MKTLTQTPAPAETLLRFCYADGRRRVYVAAHNEIQAIAGLSLAVRTAYPKEAADYWQAFTYNGNEVVYWSRGEAVQTDDAGRRWTCSLDFTFDIACDVSGSSREQVEQDADALCERLNAGISAQFALGPLVAVAERVLKYSELLQSQYGVSGELSGLTKEARAGIAQAKP